MTVARKVGHSLLELTRVIEIQRSRVLHRRLGKDTWDEEGLIPEDGQGKRALST